MFVKNLFSAARDFSLKKSTLTPLSSLIMACDFEKFRPEFVWSVPFMFELPFMFGSNSVAVVGDPKLEHLC